MIILGEQAYILESQHNMGWIN